MKVNKAAEINSFSLIDCLWKDDFFVHNIPIATLCCIALCVFPALAFTIMNSQGKGNIVWNHIKG